MVHGLETNKRLNDEAVANARGPLDSLKAAIHADSDYAWAWLYNLACIASDAGATHEDSNRRAAQFMRNAFGFDVTQCENWKQLESQWDDQKPSQVAREIAARVWCDHEMSTVVMDVEAAVQIARIIERVIKPTIVMKLG